MNEIQTTDAELLRLIMDEYEEVMNSVAIGSFGNYWHRLHVPSPFEVLSPFGDGAAEEAVFEVIKMAHQQKIFLRHLNDMIYVPLVEVW